MAGATPNYNVRIKSAVVIQLLSGERTVEELALAYCLDTEQILRWKKQVIDRLPAILAECDSGQAPGRESPGD